MRIDERGRLVPCVEGPKGVEGPPGYIVLTDPPPIPVDERCPKCDAGAEARRELLTFGTPRDQCAVCGHLYPDHRPQPVSDDEMT